MQLALITFRYSADPYSGDAAGPDALLRAGLADRLRGDGHEILGPLHTELTADEQTAYGAWNRIGLANARLAPLVSRAIAAGAFPLVLESNCYAALGVLAGLRASATGAALRLGMVWIDAHGDCNTPETTLSGMLSGIPVAIASDLCLHRLRRQADLDPPIMPRDVVMVCARAIDPLERELIDASGIEIVPVSDIEGDCGRMHAAMQRLSEAVDLIYVHFDVDALDPSELAQMRLTEPHGPKGTTMAAAAAAIMTYGKVAAFGVADITPQNDVAGQMIQSAISVTQGAIGGVSGTFVTLQVKPIGCADEGGASFAMDALRTSAHPMVLPQAAHSWPRASFDLVGRPRYPG